MCVVLGHLTLTLPSHFRAGQSYFLVDKLEFWNCFTNYVEYCGKFTFSIWVNRIFKQFSRLL